MSKGEQLICNILNKSGILYEREKHFSDLKQGKFRYDFYIPNINGGQAIIEFNGIQHYEYVSRFYKTKALWRKAQEYDRRKISYALSNNIPIYIIPYWDIDKLSSLQNLVSPQYRALTRWHNDQIYAKRKDRH